MKTLDVESINKKAPYRVWAISDKDYSFQTDYGVLCTIGFMHDYTLWEEGAYQLIINNENQKASPRDANLKETVLAIVEAFFEANPSILLYLCETGDGKQAMCNRLFLHWFHEYQYKDRYFLKTVEITAEGVNNFAALIVQYSNPDLTTIIRDFDNMISLLQMKPE